MSTIDVSGLNFFMPVFSFLLVFVVVYAVMAKTKVLGESQFVNLMVSFIMGVIFMSFSSLELYVQTIIPWFIVLLIIVFLVLVLAGLSTKDLSKIMTTQFAWVMVAILVVIFLIAAIKVFNPVFHPDLLITSGEGTSMLGQIRTYINSNGYAGSVLLLITAIIVSWILTKKVKG